MAYFRGYPCSPELAEWLTWYERVLLFKGVIRFNIDVFQLQGDYYQSVGVHKDGYAYDIAQMDPVSLDVADQMGAFSWPRTQAQGFKPHQHGGLYGIKDMNAGLAGQGRDRKNGWNGLVGRHRKRDPRPVSGRDWKQGIAWAKAQLAAEAPMTYPAQILGKHFQKVTLPVDGPDSGTWADEITLPRLLTYTSKYLRVNSAGDSVVFTCWHGGATTSGSKNPRCEGRETWTDGALAKWDGRRGKHGLKAVLAVNRLTKVKPAIVLEQVHNGDDDVATIRAEGVKVDGKLTDRIKLWGTNGDNSKYAYLGEVKRTQRFTAELDVVGGRIVFVLNGARHTKTVAATADCFFKLGNYLQSNPETAPGESTRECSIIRLFEEPEVRHAA